MFRRTMKRLSIGLLMALCACESSTERTLRARAALEKKNQEQAEAKKGAKPAAPTFSAPYNDSDAQLVVGDGPCPAGLWALFPGPAPGADDAEKKANQDKRSELAKAFEGKQFLVKLRPPAVKLSPYDAPKGQFTLEVEGLIDCKDSAGSIAIAWTETKAVNPPPSAAQEGNDLSQNVWVAKPTSFTIPMVKSDEAATFEKANQYGVSARVVFKFDKVDIDKKLKKVGKVSAEAFGEKLGYGGGVEDWGAGRLVRAKLIALRVAAEQEQKQLFEVKP